MREEHKGLKEHKKKLSFKQNRAQSEPPSNNKNAVVPVKEDLNDGCSIDYDQKGGQVIETETKQIDEAEDESSLEKSISKTPK